MSESTAVQTAVIPHEDLISPIELARRLKVKPSTISEWMRAKGSARALPYFRVGRFLRFSWREISAWMLAQRERGDRLAHVGGRKPRKKIQKIQTATSGRLTGRVK